MWAFTKLKAILKKYYTLGKNLNNAINYFNELTPPSPAPLVKITLSSSLLHMLVPIAINHKIFIQDLFTLSLFLVTTIFTILFTIISSNIVWIFAIFTLFWPYFFSSAIHTKIKDFLVRKGICIKKLNLYKYTGFKVFCVNILMLLSIGSIYLLLEKIIGLGLCNIIILVFFIIICYHITKYYNSKVIKSTILNIYFNFKKNYRYILLNKLLLWVSMRSTLILLWCLLDLFSHWFELDFNLLYTLLSINLFVVILEPFSVNCRNWGLLDRNDGLSLMCVSYLSAAEWLIKNTQIKEDQISTLDLCESNVRTLSRLFSINKSENDAYAFYFGAQRVYAVKADFIKYCEPIRDRKVDIFYTKGQFEDVDMLRNHLSTVNEKTMGIYDPKSKNLFIPVRGAYEKYEIKSNNIVYHWSTGFYAPYDPEVNPGAGGSQNRPLYIKDKESNMHDLGLNSWLFRIKDVSISCSTKFYWIKAEPGQEPIINQLSASNKHNVESIHSIKVSSKKSIDNRFI